MEAGRTQLLDVGPYIRLARFDFDGDAFTGARSQQIDDAIAGYGVLQGHVESAFLEVRGCPLDPKGVLDAGTWAWPGLEAQRRAERATIVGQLIEDNLAGARGKRHSLNQSGRLE